MKIYKRIECTRLERCCARSPLTQVRPDPLLRGERDRDRDEREERGRERKEREGEREKREKRERGIKERG